MEQKFSNNSIDLQELREFCEREGEEVTYRKGRPAGARRRPGIVEHLPLNAISSFLSITPQMLSKIRKEITFNSQQ